MAVLAQALAQAKVMGQQQLQACSSALQSSRAGAAVAAPPKWRRSHMACRQDRETAAPWIMMA